MPPWEGTGCSRQERRERARFEVAWEQFRRGDFRSCGRAAAALAADAASGQVRRRAEGLRERLRVDPLALVMAAVALALVLTAGLLTFG